MYTNIPTNELINIIDSLRKKQQVNDRLRHETVNVNQNYSQFQNYFFIQGKELAMGSPTSSIFSEVFLKFIENTTIYDIPVHNNMTGYFR